MDEILLPTIYSVLNTGLTRVLPSSARDTRSMSLMRFKETLKRSKPDISRQQMLNFFISIQYLREIWL